MTLHREGYKLVLGTLVVLLIINAALWFIFPYNKPILMTAGIISVIFFLLILQFFRNPNRNLTLNDSLIVSPADGKVVVIEEVDEPEVLNKKVRQISVFMSPVNVHSNLNPVSGNVSYYKYHKGKYLVAWHPKSSTENERTTIVYRTAAGIDILCRQIAGALAKRIVCYLDQGQQAKQGGEMGFIKFGSRVDVLIPLDAEVLVKLGDKTKGGITTLARLKS